MTIEFGLTNGVWNTQYAPLVALIAHYQENKTLKALENVTIRQKKREFQSSEKLMQILASILCGCETLSEVNVKLKHETMLAQACGWRRIADQSTLSRTLDALSLEQIEQLRQATLEIWRQIGHTWRHNWHGYLWLEYDMSPLSCGKQAEESHKGYASGKKTSPVASWLGSVRSNIAKLSGQMSFRATFTRFTA